MYCHYCGIHNTDDMKQCRMCGTELHAGEKPDNVTIFSDLTQYPYIAILQTLRKTHPFLSLIIIPFFTIIYLLKIITKTPFLSAILNSKTPKLHITNVRHFQKLHKTSFHNVSSFLEQQGFEPLLDLEDVSMVQGNIQHLTLNRQRKIYGTVHVNKASGKVRYVTFSAFFHDNGFFSVDNTFAVPIEYPDNLIIEHVPMASVEATYQECLQVLEQIPDDPLLLPLNELMPLSYALRADIINLGLEQKRLYVKGEEKHTHTSVCYQHPFNAAVRKCSVCGKALCEACYTEYQDAYYCQDCLPDEAESESPSPMFDKEEYAGFGVRTIATCLDALVISLFAVILYLSLSYLRKLILPHEPYSVIPFLATQFLTAIAIVSYLVVPLKKYGKTFGQKLFGLRVVDRYGKSPDTAAALVRFAYLLVACLFVIPLLGYLFILFRKNKQGLHDQLAGTFVITKHSAIKTLLSWSLLLLLCGGVGWQAFQYRQILSWLPWFSSRSFYENAPEIFLEAQWMKQFDRENALSSYINRDDRCIITASEAIQALDMRTGEIVWSLDNLPYTSLQPLSKDPDLPLLAIQHQIDGTVSLLNVDPASGSILWQKALDLANTHLNFDSQILLVYGGKSVVAYDRQGTLLWKRSFQDELQLKYAAIHTDILMGRYSDDSSTLTYLDRETGETLWELENSDYYPGYILAKDKQFFYKRAGNTILLNIPERKPLWEVPAEAGYVRTHERFAESEDMSQTYVYTENAVIDAKDGDLLFSYPPSTRFGAVTKDFLVLFHETQRREILLIDKSDWKVRQRLQSSFLSFVFYLTEDDSTIYLAANLKPEQPGANEMHSVLLCLHKQTFEITEIPIGKNIGTLQWELFPQKNFVFISNFQLIGGFTIPGT